MNDFNNPVLIQKIFGYLSVSRTQKYLNNTATPADTFALYELNAKLGASLWTAMHYYEVVLRNLVDRALSQSFSENWVENAAFLSMIKQQKRAAIERL